MVQNVPVRDETRKKVTKILLNFRKRTIILKNKRKRCTLEKFILTNFSKTKVFAAIKATAYYLYE